MADDLYQGFLAIVEHAGSPAGTDGKCAAAGLMHVFNALSGEGCLYAEQPDRQAGGRLSAGSR